VDGSVKHSLGILEDVAIELGNFYMLIEFIIIDIAGEAYAQIILERPFMATSGCKKDVKEKRLTFDEGTSHVEFNFFEDQTISQLYSSLMKCPVLMKLKWMMLGVILTLLCFIGFLL